MKILGAIAPMLFGVMVMVPAASAQGWYPIGDEKAFGISGLAALNSGGTEFLAVHDNKNPEEPRLGKIARADGSINYEIVSWPDGNFPVDLEAIAAIPGRDREFIALASSGQGYHIRANSEIALLGTFTLPEPHPNPNIEGFTLYDLDGILIAIWGHRGAGIEPGVLSWGVADLDRYRFDFRGSRTWSVPLPQGNVRHITDLKVDAAGVLFVSAATDRGDDGPFESAVYAAGSLRIEEGTIALQLNAEPVPLLRHRHRKIEAIELVPRLGMVLGSDDENRGASIFYP